MRRFLFIITLMFISSSFASAPNLHLVIDTTDQTTQQILKVRQQMLKHVKKGEYNSVLELVEKHDNEFLGIDWINSYERLIIYSLSNNFHKIKVSSNLRRTLWSRNHKSYYALPSSLCPPPNLDIITQSLSPTLRLEHYLWYAFKRQLEGGKIPPEIAWIESKTECDQNYDYSHRQKNLATTKANLKAFHKKFPNSTYFDTLLVKEYNPNFSWTGNGFLWSGGISFNKFPNQKSHPLIDGVQGSFGMAIYFPKLFLGFEGDIKFYTIPADYTVKDTTIQKGSMVSLNKLNWIAGYTFMLKRNLALTPYSGLELNNFNLVESGDKEIRNKYRKSSFGVPIGLFIDYVLSSSGKAGGLGFGFGLRGSLQYSLTNLSSIDPNFDDHMLTTRLEFTFGFHGIEVE